MTVEELKIEAKKLGCSVVKIRKKEKFLPCICGLNSRSWWEHSGSDMITLVCNRCGRKASGKDESEARHNWNLMIMEESENGMDKS